MLVEFLLGTICIFLTIFWKCQRRKNEPPGPIVFPLVGNLFQVALADKKGRPFVALDKLSKEYGDVMSMRFGSNNMIILSSYEALKDTMHKDAWNGRIWSEEFYDRYMNQRIGILFTEGEFWKDQRRFALRQLRDIGFGKQTSMEIKIHEELRELMEDIQSNMGDGCQTVLFMENFFNLSFLNILWTFLAGVRYERDNPNFKRLLDAVNKLFKSGSLGGGISSAFPILKKLFPKLTGNEEQIQIYKTLQEFIQEAIRDHRESQLFGSSHDFIDIYLQEVDKTKNDPNSYYTEDQLVMMCVDLFLAGSETTSGTLSFAILYMILNSDIQENVYKEIKETIGLARTPNLEDRAKLPYTEAVLMEIQRISNVVPFTPPHQLTEDVQYKQYSIFKGTPILVNLYSINMKKSYWDEPEIFRPTRFLDVNKQLIKPEQFIPFGVGQRQCFGESLARMSLFLYFTTLVQNFKFETVAGHLNPVIEPIVGFTLSPEPYHTTITKRHEFITN